MEEDALVSMMEHCSEPQVQFLHDGLKVKHFKLQRELTGRLFQRWHLKQRHLAEIENLMILRQFAKEILT
jgi:hypothetical protein